MTVMSELVYDSFSEYLPCYSRRVYIESDCGKQPWTLLLAAKFINEAVKQARKYNVSILVYSLNENDDLEMWMSLFQKRRGITIFEAVSRHEGKPVFLIIQKIIKRRKVKNG